MKSYRPYLLYIKKYSAFFIIWFHYLVFNVMLWIIFTVCHFLIIYNFQIISVYICTVCCYFLFFCIATAVYLIVMHYPSSCEFFLAIWINYICIGCLVYRISFVIKKACCCNGSIYLITLILYKRIIACDYGLRGITASLRYDISILINYAFMVR